MGCDVATGEVCVLDPKEIYAGGAGVLTDQIKMTYLPIIPMLLDKVTCLTSAPFLLPS